MQTNFQASRLVEKFPKQNLQFVSPLEELMKVNDCKVRRENTKKSSSRPGTAGRVNMAVLLTVAMAAFAAVMIAVILASMPTALKKDPSARQVRSDELVSGLRTALEMVRYLLEPEPDPPDLLLTGLREPGLTQTNLLKPAT